MRFDVVTAFRSVVGILIGGIGAALIFLIMAQGAFHKGFTDFDYAHVLGTAIQGTATEETGADALGVIGDSAGPEALRATLVGGVLLFVLHALVVVPLVRASWVVRGIVTGVVAFLVLGLVYVPYADANLDTPIGLWGSDQGGLTPLVLGLSALGACVCGARCYDLARNPDWWKVERVEVDETLERLTGVDTESLELPEQGPEQRSVSP